MVASDIWPTCCFYLASDASHARSLGENGHDAVVKQFNWDHTAKPMVQMYQELVS